MIASGLIDESLADIFNRRDKSRNISKINHPVKSFKDTVDASWHPANAKQSAIKTIEKCALIAIAHGGAEMVLFLWGLNGLMDYTTSWTASVVIAVIGGFRIAWTIKKTNDVRDSAKWHHPLPGCHRKPGIPPPRPERHGTQRPVPVQGRQAGKIVRKDPLWQSQKPAPSI